MKKTIALLLAMLLCFGLLSVSAVPTPDFAYDKARPILTAKGTYTGGTGHMDLNRWDTEFTLRYDARTNQGVLEFQRTNVRPVSDAKMNQVILDYYAPASRDQAEAYRFELSTLYHVKRERQILQNNTYGKCNVECYTSGPKGDVLVFRVTSWETEPYVLEMACGDDFWKDTHLNFDRHGEADSWPPNDEITGVHPLKLYCPGVLDPEYTNATGYDSFDAVLEYVRPLDAFKIIDDLNNANCETASVKWIADDAAAPEPPAPPKITLQGSGTYEDLGNGKLKIIPWDNCKLRSVEVNGKPVEVGRDYIIDYQPGDVIVIKIVEDEPAPTQAPDPTAAPSSAPVASSQPAPTARPSAPPSSGASPAPSAAPSLTPGPSPAPVPTEPPKLPPAGVASDRCGDELYWRYASGTLTIYGKGPMYEYGIRYDSPWLPYRDEIETVVIEPGCTYIGSCAFDTHRAVRTVHIPVTVTAMGDSAFFRCSGMTDIYFGGTRAQWDAISTGIGNSALWTPTLHCLGDGAAPIVSTGIDPMDAGTALASTQGVDIDGRQVELQAYALQDAMGNQTNYVKVRDVAAALDGTAGQFNVDWSDGVDLVTGVPYTTRNGQENRTPYSGNRHYERADAPTKVNGQAVGLSAFILKDDNGNGSTYYKLRDLGQALGFNVGWSADRGIFLEPGVVYTAEN